MDISHQICLHYISPGAGTKAEAEAARVRARRALAITFIVNDVLVTIIYKLIDCEHKDATVQKDRKSNQTRQSNYVYHTNST